jgi:uncharacterized protein YqjF (DUF2071 family)
VNSPAGVPFLTAAWRFLCIANFEVGRARIERLVPRDTEIDLFRGRALVSLVGFRFLDTRILGVPISGHRDFDEVNLRIYVRRRMPEGEWRRGVSFIREFVPRRAIAWVARLCYHEPYRALPMRHHLEFGPDHDGDPTAVSYGWHLGGRWNILGATMSGPPAPPAPGSEAEFTVEHYWGYTARPDGTTTEYEVRHAPWRVWRAASSTLDIDAGLTYGPEWSDLLATPPTSVLVAEGSLVEVFSGRRLGGPDSP